MSSQASTAVDSSSLLLCTICELCCSLYRVYICYEMLIGWLWQWGIRWTWHCSEGSDGARSVKCILLCSWDLPHRHLVCVNCSNLFHSCQCCHHLLLPYRHSSLGKVLVQLSCLDASESRFNNVINNLMLHRIRRQRKSQFLWSLKLLEFLLHEIIVVYRIFSRISRPVYKPTPIPAADNVAKISDPRISQ